jgi:hypothetical protein
LIDLAGDRGKAREITMNRVMQLDDYRFPSGFDKHVARLAVPLGKLCAQFKGALQSWDEDGIGRVRGAFIQLPSGRVVLLRELELLKEIDPCSGTDVFADGGDVGRLGAKFVANEVIDALGVPLAVSWCAGDEASVEATEILQYWNRHSQTG